MSKIIQIVIAIIVVFTIQQNVSACAPPPSLPIAAQDTSVHVDSPVRHEVPPLIKLDLHSYSPGDCDIHFAPPYMWEFVFRSGLKISVFIPLSFIAVIGLLIYFIHKWNLKKLESQV